MLYPWDVAVLPGGRVLVCEYGNNRLQVFGGPQGEGVTISGAGRTPGKLSAPRGIAFVPDRGVYVADTGNHRVQLLAVPAAQRVAMGGD